jgi:hypothetical protein
MLKNRLVHFTATAEEHVRREKAWWLAQPSRSIFGGLLRSGNVRVALCLNGWLEQNDCDWTELRISNNSDIRWDLEYRPLGSDLENSQQKTE